MKTHILFLSFCFLVHCSLAQVQYLDTSYNINGYNRTHLLGTYSSTSGSFINFQSNGKIVCAGITTKNTDKRIFLARFNANGLVDSSFHGNGTVTTPTEVPLGLYPSIHKFFTQSDDKLLVFVSEIDGWGTGATELASAYRYKVNGSLDSSFGFNGRKSFVWANQSAGNIIESATIQNDGKMVVLGSMHSTFYGPQLDDSVVVCRVNQDGSVDSSFRGGGYYSTMEIKPLDITMKTDGKIICLGRKIIGGNTNNITLIRLLPSGQLDSSFGNAGMLTKTYTHTIAPFQIINDSLDKMWIFGRYNDSLFITKLDENGIEDISFNASGFRSYPLNGLTLNNGNQEFTIYKNMAFNTPDGFIISGTSWSSDSLGQRYDNTMIACKILKNSQIDLNFGINGYIQVAFDSLNHFGSSAIIDQNDRVIMVGSESNWFGSDMITARLLPTLLITTSDFIQNTTPLVLVYPNPIINNKLNLQLDMDGIENISVSLLDLHGRTLHSFCNNQLINMGQTTLPLDFPNSIASGSYILQVTSSKGISAIQVFK